MIAILATVVLSFPPWSKLGGELYVAPDGNYVGLVELGEGAVLRLWDGFRGYGAWCGDLVSSSTSDVVCGTGQVLRHSAGVRLRLVGPGVVVDEVMLKGTL